MDRRLDRQTDELNRQLDKLDGLDGRAARWQTVRS